MTSGPSGGAAGSVGGASLRLGVGSNLGRYSPLDPIHVPGDRASPQSNSASLSKAQRDIKVPVYVYCLPDSLAFMLNIASFKLIKSHCHQL